MYHKVTLLGRLGRDPEMRFTADGKPVTSFSVAIDDSYGETKKVVWVRVSVWGKQAESCNQYLSKGRQVYIEGRLGHENGNPRVFTRNDGTTGASFEVTAHTVKFIGGQSQSDGAQGNAPRDEDVPPEASGNVAPF